MCWNLDRIGGGGYTQSRQHFSNFAVSVVPHVSLAGLPGKESNLSMACSMAPEVLERIWFYTNFDCNMSCRYCVAMLPRGVMRPRLELSTFRRLVDQAKELGFRHLGLTGGEPFMHPGIVDMVDFAASRIDTVVLTNASFVTPGLLGDLARVDRSRLTLQVSLDSAEPDLNDRLRGRGSWRKAVRGLEMLQSAGFAVAVRATLDGHNEETVPDLMRLVCTLNVPASQVYGAPAAKVGRATRGIELSRRTLFPEPTVTGDGLYWHPLLIEPATAVSLQIDPLKDGLHLLGQQFEELRPARQPDVR
jgi:sulfatase maturation enzyme AslB (radical SAM superfamily)